MVNFQKAVTLIEIVVERFTKTRIEGCIFYFNILFDKVQSTKENSLFHSVCENTVLRTLHVRKSAFSHLVI